jgi:hypothetical protein
MTAQMSSFVRDDYMHSLLPAPQGQASGLSELSKNPQYVTHDRAMQGLGIAQKVESHSSLQMSIKTFQKLDLKEGKVLGDRADRFVSKLASILKSVSAQQNHISSVHINGRAGILRGYNKISPQELKRLRNIIKSSYSVCVNTSCGSHLLLIIRQTTTNHGISCKIRSKWSRKTYTEAQHAGSQHPGTRDTDYAA